MSESSADASTFYLWPKMFWGRAAPTTSQRFLLVFAPEWRPAGAVRYGKPVYVGAVFLLFSPLRSSLQQQGVWGLAFMNSRDGVEYGTFDCVFEFLGLRVVMGAGCEAGEIQCVGPDLVSEVL